METGIFIRVNNKVVDIGNPKLNINNLLEWIMSLDHHGQVRLVMSLLGRREEYEEHTHKNSLKQP